MAQRTGRHEAATQRPSAWLPQASVLYRGKVREVFDLGDRLLLVATDRLSAYDHVLPTPIPGRGIVLTQLSRFWFEHTRPLAANHMISTELAAIAEALDLEVGAIEQLEGRAMLVRRAQRIDFECVVRGYLAGSAWRAYEREGAVCGIALPPGLREGDRLERPIFTPATKEEHGHDVNVPFEAMVDALGRRCAERIRRMALTVYEAMHAHALERGLVLADTKIEVGWIGGEPALIDELGTPDSSRYWERTAWERERALESFDKQIVRDFLARAGWHGQSEPALALPEAVVRETRARYLEAYRRLVGTKRVRPERV